MNQLALELEPVIAVRDDFISGFHLLREWADLAEYEDIVNPVDGVTYPGICDVIPEMLQFDIKASIQDMVGRAITVNYMFMRLSLEGVSAPHQAHNDISMGTHSLMLYLSREEDCQGGTGFVLHKESGIYGTHGEHADLIMADTNEYDAWETYKLVEMQPNRGLVFSSELLHRAEPVNGFGSDSKRQTSTYGIFLVIRKATVDDFDDILAMSMEFWKSTVYNVPADEESILHYVCIAADHNMLAVIDINGKAEGFCAGCKAPLMGNKDYCIGVELAWWVNPEHRHGGEAIKLMKFMEQLAKEAGVQFWHMIAMNSSEPNVARKIYERLGYSINEYQYLKEL